MSIEAENSLAVVRLFKKGEFTAREFERAVCADSSYFKEGFFGNFLSEEMKQWRDSCNAEVLLDRLFEWSFAFGACGTFDTYEREMRFESDLKEASLRHRSRLFEQAVIPDKELMEWIDKTGCEDFICSLYEEAYKLGGWFISGAIAETQIMFGRE